jgi:RsiW-degrading membrane proteinase PrsW (M82 family)
MLAQTSDTLFTLSLVLIVALVYMFVLRLMDANEKEPAWSLAVALVLGGLAAILVDALIDPATLEGGFLGSVARGVAWLIALAALLVVLSAIGRTRGIHEFNGLMDGVVYGAAVGLGFALGLTLVNELATQDSLVGLATSRFDQLWAAALDGLKYAIFGGLVGLGLGLGALTRNAGAKVIAAVVGLVLGVLADYGYFLLAEAGALTEGGLTRRWIGLGIPVLFVILVMAVALGRERRAINEELPPEVEAGVVPGDDLELLRSFGARRGRYARMFFKGDFDGWLALRELHHREVQLALAKHRHPEDRSPEDQAELEQLRANIAAARDVAQAKGGPSVFKRRAKEGV